MEIYELLAKRIMKEAIPEDYVQWAEGLLQKGEDRESVKILAALTLTKPVYWFDVDEYFKKVLKDLKIDDSDDEAILMEYSKLVAQRIIDNTIEPVEGVHKLSQVYVASDYCERYSNWDLLEDDVSNFLFDGTILRDIPLKECDLTEYVKEETKLFLRFLEMDLPENFFGKTICKNCQNFDEPKHERKRFRWLPIKWYRRLLLKYPQFESK